MVFLNLDDFPGRMISDKSRKYSVWYCQKMKMGNHWIDSLMKNLSIDLSLSRFYRNHYMKSRVILVTILKEQVDSNAEVSQMNILTKTIWVLSDAKERKNEDLSCSLQSGSSTVVQMERISKGRIVISRSNPNTNDIAQEKPTVNVSFNGTFYNYHFECK